MNAPQGHNTHIKSTTAHERLCGNNGIQGNKAVAGECSSSTTGP